MATPFSFELASSPEAAPRDAASHAPFTTDQDGRLRMAVEASGLATYHWIIDSDDIAWSSNAAEILGADPHGFATGRSFAACLDPENFTSRYDTVMRSSAADDGTGVPFQIEYKFRPEGRLSRANLWLEDHGRWFGGEDGRPVEVFGTLRRIDDRHMRDQHLSFLGNCDPLTGMMNRGRMMESLGGAMAAAARDNTTCALVIAAINNLSVVNDAYGFEVADEVIINMGRRLRQVVRTGDAIARYSGSKFGLILNNCTEDDLAVAAERFLGVARESVIETERGPVWALLSIGALVLPRHAADTNMAVARAEEALTEARKLPSDGFVIYKPSQQRSSERSLNAHSATEIVRCLRENRFRLAFQPVVDAVTGAPMFHEALLRMTDSAGEIIAAGHLIPVAEKLGLVRLIDRAVVQMTVEALNKYPGARLSFNISGTTATDPRWYPQITEILASNRQVTNRLTIEITETVALGDLRETIRFVDQLRELGCNVAIDDFGAGYTSFRNLRAMPVDVLKLDGTFCSNLAGNSDNQYFVRALIDMARTFGIKTVAEWVETEEDADLLRRWQVDMMQGNLFGEASLDPPWPEVAGAEVFQIDAAVPFVLPSEISWALPEVAAKEEPGRGPTGEAMNAFDFTEAPETATPDEPQEESIAAELAIADTAAEVEVSEAASADVAIETPPAAEPALATVAAFEEDLAAELNKLRQAITALDLAFQSRPAPEPRPPSAEPSFADLVSDTAMRAAG